MVKLCKNYETAQNSPLSDARFTRRKPGQRTVENQKPSLRYKRARYYHAQLGRFISRDPLGFVDGMSLYRAYFVPGGVDPKGLQTVASVPTVPPGDLLSDNPLIRDGDSICCGGKKVTKGKECCVKNRNPGASESKDPLDWTFAYPETAKTKCKVCWRQAQVPGGSFGPYVATYHMWIKCEFGEVGLGELGGTVPGVSEDGGYESPTPLPTTGINDHSGQSVAKGSGCQEISISACCIARQMVPRPTGKRCGPPPMFNCNTYVFEAIEACGVSRKTIRLPWKPIFPEDAGKGLGGMPLLPSW